MSNSSDIIAVLRPYYNVLKRYRDIDAEGWVIYAQVLSDIPAEVVGLAMRKWAETDKEFPAPAQIRDTAEGLVRHSNGTSLPTPEEAWAEAMKLNRSYGPHEEWPFSCDEVREAVRRFGGKLELAMITDEGLNTARAQFRRCYDGVVNSARDKRASDSVLCSPEIKERLGETYKRLIEGAG